MKHSFCGLERQSNTGLIRFPWQLLLWAALCLPFALNATAGEGGMQPASPQVAQDAISPVQALASAAHLTIEIGAPAGHGPGDPCAGHGGHPCDGHGPGDPCAGHGGHPCDGHGPGDPCAGHGGHPCGA